MLTGCCTIVSGGYGLDKWKDFANRWHTDYDFKTFVNSFGSALITLAFAIFNFVLGIKSSSPWHISIAIYYVFLTGIRVFLIHSGTRHADSRNILILAAASLYMTEFTAHVWTEGTKLKATASTDSNIEGTKSIDLSADITANAYGGTGVQNTGTTGDNTTYLGSMEISWK